MNENLDLKNTYNKIAKDWNADHSIDEWWIEPADKFLSLFPKGAHILDVGCAGGLKTNYINEKGFNADGIDFSEEMIKDAKIKFPDLNFEVVDVYDINKYSKTFDGIFAQAVLLHIPKKDVLEVLQKIKGKLNKGGLIYVAVKEQRAGNTEEEIKTENDYGYEYKRFFSYYTLDELKNYFTKLDIDTIYENVATAGRTNWINIIGKIKI